MLVLLNAMVAFYWRFEHPLILFHNESVSGAKSAVRDTWQRQQRQESVSIFSTPAKHPEGKE